MNNNILNSHDSFLIKILYNIAFLIENMTLAKNCSCHSKFALTKW